MMNVSNPSMGPMDMLSRLSHDNDEAVAQNAILALGAHPTQRTPVSWAAAAAAAAATESCTPYGY